MVDIIRWLASQFHFSLLVLNNSYRPYTWLYARPKSSHRLLSLNPSKIILLVWSYDSWRPTVAHSSSPSHSFALSPLFPSFFSP